MLQHLEKFLYLYPFAALDVHDCCNLVVFVVLDNVIVQTLHQTFQCFFFLGILPFFLKQYFIQIFLSMFPSPMKVHLVISTFKGTTLHQTFEYFGLNKELLFLLFIQLHQLFLILVSCILKGFKPTVGTLVQDLFDMPKAHQLLAASTVYRHFDPLQTYDAVVLTLVVVAGITDRQIHVIESNSIMFSSLNIGPYNHMNSHHSNKEQFLSAEASIGITRQNYQKKYVYDPNHPSENFILDRLIPTPSQLQGLNIEQEKAISYLMGEIIFRAAESLQLPVSTAVVSASLAHFYFSRVSFIEQDFRDIAMGSMFLACRSEQTIRRSGQISAVFDHVFKIFEGQKMPIKIQIFQSTEYVYMKDKVVEGEKKILFELGFEIHRLLDIPHRYIGGLFTSFDRHPQSKKICQTAWKHLNDFYRTNVCVYYPGQIIAAAAVYLSLIKLNIKMPPVAWWTLLEANIDCIQELIGQLQYFYQTSKQSKYTMDWVAQQLTEVGNRHDLVNVFPINYYRKIMLDLNSQLRVNKSMLQAQQQMMNALQKTEKQDKSRSRERQTEKKKKKDKKKKDKKKKKDRGGSSERNMESESQSAILKNQKNHEDTPLRKNTENANESSQLEVEKSQGLEEYPKKQTVQKLKVEDPKSLLSRIHEQIQQRKKQIKQASSSSDSDQDSEDEAAIALLRQKKKQNQAKKQA